MKSINFKDQLIIFTTIILILTVVFFSLTTTLKSNEKKINMQIIQNRAYLEQIRILVNKLESLEQEPVAPLMKESLSSFIESVAKNYSIQDNLQLNVFPESKRGMERVQVRFEQLNLNQFIEMLYNLENQWPIILISKIIIGISPGDRKVRVSFQAQKQTEI